MTTVDDDDSGWGRGHVVTLVLGYIGRAYCVRGGLEGALTRGPEGGRLIPGPLPKVMVRKRTSAKTRERLGKYDSFPPTLCHLN